MPDKETHDALRAILSPVEGRKKSNRCIVIPTGTQFDLLDAHLKLLAKQDTDNFDVLIIGKRPTLPSRLNILSCDEIYPVGSSGGFGLGQVQAYLLGYEYIINADLDCLPISTNLISTLVSMAGENHKVIEPLSMSNRNYDPKKINDKHNINHYGTVPREILEQYGFVNFRFYRGGEELDFDTRLEAEGALIYEKGVFVEHENTEANYIERMSFKGNKYVYYVKNLVVADIHATAYRIKRLMIGKALRYFATTLQHLFLNIIFTMNHPDLLKAICIDGLKLDLESIYCNRTKIIETTEMKSGAVSAIIGTKEDPFCDIVFMPKKWLLENRKKTAVLKLFGAYLKTLQSRADYLEPTPNFLNDYKFFMQYMLFLKPIKYKDGKIYTDGTNAMKTAFGTSLVVIAFPALATIVLLATLRCVFRKDNEIRSGNLASQLTLFRNFLNKFNRVCTHKRIIT